MWMCEIDCWWGRKKKRPLGEEGEFIKSRRTGFGASAGSFTWKCCVLGFDGELGSRESRFTGDVILRGSWWR